MLDFRFGSEADVTLLNFDGVKLATGTIGKLARKTAFPYQSSQ
jgi:hypothetical protein